MRHASEMELAEAFVTELRELRASQGASRRAAAELQALIDN